MVSLGPWMWPTFVCAVLESLRCLPVPRWIPGSVKAIGVYFTDVWTPIGMGSDVACRNKEYSLSLRRRQLHACRAPLVQQLVRPAPSVLVGPGTATY